MAAENLPKTSDELVTAATVTKQRKKRKWDQPAECFISAGATVPGTFPLAMGGTVLNSPVQSCNASAVAPQSVILPQSAAAIIQKLNQPKTQDEHELISREIVINDADPLVRYKLTKSQTQEEIHRCTGAVVITRGKYRPPNGLADNEKPLYLHISAGTHLKEMADRIKAVDRAATMIEEFLKQGQNSTLSAGAEGSTPYTTCVFLGFEPDPSVNITARIRGPNDQYINHIMNVTGVVATIRGKDSGCPANSVEDQNMPLHIFISSNNARSLEEAKRLAENLLDTICKECGASRVSSYNVYGAVPPPNQTAVNIQRSSSELNSPHPITPLAYPIIPSTSIAPSLPEMTAISIISSVHSAPQQTSACYPHPSVSKGTSYAGYEGIYPQATPLQQVALALRQAPLATSVSASTSTRSTPLALNASKTSSLNSIFEGRTQRRKFQELPVAASGASIIQNECKELEHLSPGTSLHSSLEDPPVAPSPAPPSSTPPVNGNGLPHPRSPSVSTLSLSSMPPPPLRNVSISPSASGNMSPAASILSPLPSRSMPPPPAKGDNTTLPKNQKLLSPTETECRHISTKKETSKQVPDTLLKLMDYGEEEDDEEEVSDGSKKQLPTSLSTAATVKPFWAV